MLGARSRSASRAAFSATASPSIPSLAIPIAGGATDTYLGGGVLLGWML
jgi:hypothetical protein